MPAFGNDSGSSNPARIAAPYSARRPFARSLRSASLVVFVMSMVLSACGRQITGLGSATSNVTVQPGFMSLRFRVKAPLDFTNVRYVIVFNTSGSGGQPFANALVSGFQNFSFAWIVGGTGGNAQPQLVQFFSVPGTGTGLQTQPVVVPPQNVQLQVGTNGNAGEFTLTFARISFNVPNPAVTASPSGAPSASPSPSSGPTPTPTGATPAPSLLPTTPAQVNWNVNFFTTDPSGNPIDANGTQGILDTSFVQVVNVTTAFTGPAIVKPAGSTVVNNQSAAIDQDEVDNNP
jgi:hypothetical protein